MTEAEEPEQETGPAYRWMKNARALDQFISGMDRDGQVTTGWALVRVSQSVEDDPSAASYSYYDPPNQTIHVTRGLYAMADSEYDERCRRGSVVEDDDDEA
jgi:hypothetical protein